VDLRKYMADNLDKLSTQLHGLRDMTSHDKVNHRREHQAVYTKTTT
jgi:hypothetical protein